MNELKLRSRLEPHLVSESENLVALERSLSEGEALKFGNFQKVRIFGAT